MKSFKRLLASAAVAAAAIVLVACGAGKSSSSSKAGTESNPIKVGIMTTDKPIWTDVQKRLAKDNVTIKLVEFTDYNQPNTALENGELQLNAFQHHNFLDNWNKKHDTKIAAIGDTYIGPMRAYSNKIKSLKDLKKGDKVSVPNDPSNEGRALQLLEENGLIKLKKVASPTTRDITENKLDLQITELDATQTAKSLDDVAASVVNNDIAASAGLTPDKAIAVEKIDAKSKPWVNFIAAKTAADKSNKTYEKIVKAYQTDATAKLIEKVYKGSTLPAWNYKF
ncbi:MetQ/NlpA family ABC transporter substrate-binding protein [Lacticaseibacillus brantae]|uniref:Lipoprotein n=1 Tax=Lacticaseibacillus brantae DSM 23927 TaxID=1423727 RepID=A0A0R2B4R7_9LACO|nr:MetQ/NlpA family ABC transporter substrate-binding protein [Lacticaseibacillus brantae]KRM72932.1 ABC-type metal ion transport system, periplasmic component surface antigen [Lacticaseibacillus brantae DSM 23927]